jgi:hypothetical protein
MLIVFAMAVALILISFLVISLFFLMIIFGRRHPLPTGQLLAARERGVRPYA